MQHESIFAQQNTNDMIISNLTTTQVNQGVKVEFDATVLSFKFNVALQTTGEKISSINSVEFMGRKHTGTFKDGERKAISFDGYLVTVSLFRSALNSLFEALELMGYSRPHNWFEFTGNFIDFNTPTT